MIYSYINHLDTLARDGHGSSRVYSYGGEFSGGASWAIGPYRDRPHYSLWTYANSPLVDMVHLVDFDLGSAKDIRVVGILGHDYHRIEAAGGQPVEYRVRLGTTLGGSDVYSGSFTDLSYYEGTPGNTIIDLGATYSARYVNIYLYVYDNNGTRGLSTLTPPTDTLFQVRRYWAGPGYEFATRQARAIGSMDTGSTQSALGGTVYARSRVKPRIMRLTLMGSGQGEFIGAAGAMEECLTGLQYVAGKSGEIIALPGSAYSQFENERLGIYGMVQDMSAVRMVGSTGATSVLSGAHTELDITIREIKVKTS